MFWVLEDFRRIEGFGGQQDKMMKASSRHSSFKLLVKFSVVKYNKVG